MLTYIIILINLIKNQVFLLFFRIREDLVLRHSALRKFRACLVAELDAALCVTNNYNTLYCIKHKTQVQTNRNINNKVNYLN